MLLTLLDLGRDQAPSWAPLGASLALLLVLLLLWFSMRRHLKRAAKFAGEDGVDIHAPRTARPTAGPPTDGDPTH